MIGFACVTRVYSGPAVFDIVSWRFVLHERPSSMSVNELQPQTGATLHCSGLVAGLIVPEL